MHHHAYLWTGPKPRFDQDALRRPPHPDPPPHGSRPELVQRYREVAAQFTTSDLPPLETAYWLVKPGTQVRGTWRAGEPGAVTWLSGQLDQHSPRFVTARQRTALLASVAERLRWGGDVSLGFYLERPAFLSLALVACSPNRAQPNLTCPAQGPPGPGR
ncbi:hypothetical protein ACGFZL_14995 [Streptomyces sp. NPDC048182]|uniref:hypothetical protein n=1 Tax=Streptomyces sp. NPDC048182 TaxID=3365507 RepID=UPI00371EEB76